MKSRPEPETREAFLMSAGTVPMRPTKHVFAESVPGTVQFPHGPKAITVFMYKCTETGAVRKWGYS